MRYYTGVGSQETPSDILDVMIMVGRKLASKGWVLRSGAAKGADSAFELGWFQWWAEQTPWPNQAYAEIYLPWNGFNSHGRDACFGGNIVPSMDDYNLWKQAIEVAKEIHPYWDRCSPAAKKLHTRNVYQVLGKDLKTPSRFVVAYSKLDKHGEPTGGTRTAIKLAEKYEIDCFNLYKPVDLARIQEFIKDFGRD